MNLKKSASKAIIMFATTLLLVSCIPQKHIVLMQDTEESGQTTFPALEHITDKYVLQPNDYLFINVSSPDPNLSKFFNPITNSGGNVANSSDRDFFYYQIDDSMNINFPICGKINLRECNMANAQERINAAISDYLTDFSLTVRLASNSFSVLGEVNNQGTYTMSRDQITIYDALAQAGGFATYAKRREIKLVRKNEKGEAILYDINLTERKLINSEFYYVYPNDVIYVRPMKIKMLGFGETFSLSLITSIVTFYLLIISL